MPRRACFIGACVAPQIKQVESRQLRLQQELEAYKRERLYLPAAQQKASGRTLKRLESRMSDLKLELDLAKTVDVTQLEAWCGQWAGSTKGELKQASLELATFRPGGGQVGAALGLLVLGFGLTLALGRGAPKDA